MTFWAGLGLGVGGGLVLGAFLGVSAVAAWLVGGLRSGPMR